MAVPGRQYGLILPKKTQPLHRVLPKPSVFGNDSDDDDDETSVSESLQREAAKKQAMKQTKLEIQKALAEDPTVYDYDSIYDEMQRKKEESDPKLLLGKDRKPKYIHNLLKAVEIRKKEQEKRMEKKIQREREMEKGEFDDKEAFVTSAYKKRLEERAEEEEREKKAAALEALLDVTKQNDLSGFYRHLLNQTVGEEAVPKSSFHEARTEIKEEKPRGYSDETNAEHRPPQQNCVLQRGVEKEEENPDADSDFDTKSSDDDERGENKVNHRREDTDASRTRPRHHKSQSCSRSSSEERGHSGKHHARGSKSRGHEQTRGQHQDRSRGQESCHVERSHREEKNSHRHREADHKDHYWKRHEQEDKLKGREQRERQDTEWKRDRYSSREQERDRYSEREKKSKEKGEHVKGGKERYEKNGKYREREKQDGSGQSSERHRERREGSPRSRPKDECPDQDRSRRMRDTEKDKGDHEKPSRSETSLATKHRLAEERPEKASEQERPPEAASKFAKRSNEETVMSARDRYLARQMARINAKTYIEKEDD
ncbi:nuclear speckle splicing regulatory protein 1 [Acomys russatus]|uniref:nuclear speckle splicing regulatory protein 1 n=1 Tax=Acomys russatus TaxID=60746 RepID=UPI0021E32E6F|nr:nuclear speckle splicing regulatory protein 1 [Acomys russatus]